MPNQTEQTCQNCNETFLKNTPLNDPNGDVICQSCFDDTCVKCDDCNDLIWVDDGNSVNAGDNIVCGNCLDRNYSSCSDCDESFQDEDFTETSRGDFVCDSCRGEYYFRCSSCEELCHNDDYGADGYCDDCYEENSGGGRGHEIRNKITFTEGKEPGKIITINQMIGVESELTTKGKVRTDLVPKGVNAHYDGSISGRGFEFVTHPASLDVLEDRVIALCKATKEMGYEVHKSCGLHIHLDCRNIIKNDILQDNIALCYVLFEPVLFAMLPTTRRNNSYCRGLNHDFCKGDRGLAEDFIKKGLKPRSKMLRDNRYRAVNFSALTKHGTIEVRSHSPTQDPNKILRWVDIHQHILKFAEKLNTDHVLYYLRSKKLDSRFNRMTELIGLSKETKQYMKKRIEEFK